MNGQIWKLEINLSKLFRDSFRETKSSPGKQAVTAGSDSGNRQIHMAWSLTATFQDLEDWKSATH